MYHDREKTSTVNFITCHDGFTLNDLVSYNEKHNIANGEDNRDGANDNNSWNCGVEGPTDDPEIEALRNRQVKNAFALLMLSRGTPMMLAGDEFRNSQQGNNNPYCQDSPLSWVNWAEKDAHEDVFQFFRAMIHLRRNHPVLRRRDYYTAHNSSGYPELSFHGEQAWNINIHEPFHTFGFMYAEPMDEFGTEKDCFIYCGVNAHWEQHRLELPQLPYGMAWYMYADTAVVDAEKIMGYEIPEGYIDLTPRSLKVLVGRQAPTSHNR
jgi:glycogen operon protein